MFNPNRLLADDALAGYLPLDVGAFLKGVDSPLSGLSLTGGTPAAQLDQVARAVGLDPRILIVKLQVEQSLITQPATADRLDWALGYGVPDQGPRDETYRGFSNQLQAAAGALKGYLDPHSELSVVGWVGQAVTVSDGVIHPENLPTAALYRYTPWIGDHVVGNLTPPFGNCLFSQVWTEFFGALEPDPASDTPWKLIVPPTNWQQPLPLPANQVATFQEVARRLGLAQTTDTQRRKLYLGLPSASDSLLYPSGYRAQLAPALSPQEMALYQAASTGPSAPLIVADPTAHLSEHFLMGEFLPHDSSYRYARIAPELVQLLEDLRHALGDHPLGVSSGYRPADYNQAVGGASESVHTDGLAADVVSDAVPYDQLAAAADRLVGDRGGVGFYPEDGHVHLDLRGSRARWP